MYNSRTVAGKCGVKASGGVRTLEEVRDRCFPAKIEDSNFEM